MMFLGVSTAAEFSGRPPNAPCISGIGGIVGQRAFRGVSVWSSSSVATHEALAMADGRRDSTYRSIDFPQPAAPT
jgi:hypothetical protein